MDISALEIKRKCRPLIQTDKDYCKANSHFISSYPNKSQKVNSTTESSTTRASPATVLYSTTKTLATLQKS